MTYSKTSALQIICASLTFSINCFYIITGIAAMQTIVLNYTIVCMSNLHIYICAICKEAQILMCPFNFVFLVKLRFFAK